MKRAHGRIFWIKETSRSKRKIMGTATTINIITILMMTTTTKKRWRQCWQQWWRRRRRSRR